MNPIQFGGMGIFFSIVFFIFLIFLGFKVLSIIEEGDHYRIARFFSSFITVLFVIYSIFTFIGIIVLLLTAFKLHFFLSIMLIATNIIIYSYYLKIYNSGLKLIENFMDDELYKQSNIDECENISKSAIYAFIISQIGSILVAFTAGLSLGRMNSYNANGSFNTSMKFDLSFNLNTFTELILALVIALVAYLFKLLIESKVNQNQGL